MSVSQETLVSALSEVVDPVVNKRLGELKSIREVSIEGDTAKATVDLLSPATGARDAIVKALEEAAARVGVKRLELTVGSAVRTRQIAGDDPCPEVKNVIPVMSGKGGVGKSTVAANLALALLRSGARVGLLDADIYGPSVPTMLGIMGRPISRDGKHIEPLERFGLKIMSIGFLLEDPRQSTTPQDVALMDVYKSVSMCQKLNVPILGIVENMSHFIDSAGVKHEIFGRGGGARIAEFAKAPLLGQVPIDSAVREWGDNGTPIVQAQPNSIPAMAFKEIAERLADCVTRAVFDAHGGSAPVEGPKRLPILR
ncbi:MAG: P-loop NTPase [Deltaproteobacteria bacterium]|nr:P-loop NTPase [Deltaproteobacteria bacterium]